MLFVLLALLVPAAAQKTDAVCTAGFEWMFNSLSQSPCQVASYLEGACIDTVFNIGKLPAGQHYVGPGDPSLSTECACSAVTYSLVAACGACQGTTEWQKWSSWITNCSAGDINKNGFSHAIPAQTRIPAWAFVDVVAPDQFELQSAKAVADQNKPDIGPQGSKKKGAPVGAIVGGVIGGLALIGIIAAVLVFFCLRHRRNTARPSYEPAMAHQPGFLGDAQTYPHQTQPSFDQSTPYSHPGNITTPTLYDPAPNTHSMYSSTSSPYDIHAPTPRPASQSQPYTPPSMLQQYPQHPHHVAPHGYTGAAEL
ncbi:hypothetical protein AURDEDRAFT_153107 [Auricularia subglabra TFB-10046 SS5]|nr:hypothetical protein AURDEDRAFT_153107 [Auricularia subglabra TFB-10046 SS5]